MDNNEKDLKDKAYNLHIQGKFDEAKVIYEEILNNNPDNISVCFLYADLLNSLNQFDKAIAYYNKVYAVTKSDEIKQNIVMAYYNSGDYIKAAETAEEINDINIDLLKIKANVYIKLNDIDKAVENLKLIYEKDNTATYALFNISIFLKQKEDYKSAYEYALKSYEADKNNLQYIMNLSEICEKLRYTDELIFYLQKVEEIDSNNESILLKLGFLFESKFQFRNALLYYGKTLDKNPQNYIAIIKIALLFIKTRDKKNSLKYVQKAEEIDAQNYNTFYVYCKYFRLIKDWENMLKYAKKLMEKDNNNPVSYSELFDAYNQLFDYDSALKCCSEAINKGYDITDNTCRKAICLNNMGRIDEAINVMESYTDESSDDYKIMHAAIYFSNKKFKEGLKYYCEIVSPDLSERINKKENKISFAVGKRFFEYYKKLWQREDLTNKTILVHQGPHGFGDFLMFSRYIPLLEKIAGRVVIEVPSNFYELFKYNFKNSLVVQETDVPYKDYDYTTSAMELLYNMNMDFYHIPFPEGWLNVPEEKIKNPDILSLFNTSKKKVGIFWKGTVDTMIHRMAELEDYIPLFDLDNCQFYSLDITEHDEETLEIFKKYNIINCKPHIKNAMDSAAILKNLDVLVTIDSFPLHLAGAIGVKTNLLLPGNAEWRWFRDTQTTPWYNSVRIFKQTDKPGWRDVILRVKEDLKNN